MVWCGRAIMVLITNSAAAGRDVSAAAAERFWREQHLQQQQQNGDAVSSQVRLLYLHQNSRSTLGLEDAGWWCGGLGSIMGSLWGSYLSARVCNCCCDCVAANYTMVGEVRKTLGRTSCSLQAQPGSLHVAALQTMTPCCSTGAESQKGGAAGGVHV